MASSGSFNTGSYGSGDWNRYLNFSWSIQSQSIANNTTTIYWELRGAGGATNNYYLAAPFRVVIDGSERYYSSSRINLWNGTLVASGTYTMSHNSVGEKSFSAYVEGAIYTYSINVSGSGSWSLTTIPRQATITSAPNFTDEQNPTIGYNNPAGNNVTTLQACIADTTGSTIYVPYRDISKTGSSYTFQLTEQERETLRYATINSGTLAVKFYIKTVIGGNTLYSTSQKILTIANANPTFTASYEDSLNRTVAITGNDQLIVRNQSRLQITAANLSAKKGASIRTVEAVVNGFTYSATPTTTSCTLSIGTLNLSSNTTATVTVTDSRGYTTTQNLDITVLNWEQPSGIVTMQRENNFYSTTEITVDGSYSSVDGKNAMTIQLRYKKVTDTTWSSYTTMQDNVMQTFTLDNNYAWDVQVLITDSFGGSTTYNLTLNRGMPIIYFDRLKSSVGFNCFPEEQQSVEINGLNVMRSVMTRNLTDNISSPTTGSYVKLNLSGTNSYGVKLTATNDGGIQVGAGISKLLVSGRMLISYATNNANEFYLRICKNTTDNTVGWVSYMTQGLSSSRPSFESLAITPLLMNVQEGDVIYMYYYVGTGTPTIYGGSFGNQTSLTVETVG